MKQSFLYAWCLSAAGCASLLHAQSVSQFPDSGPETTLDSLWEATGHMQAFSDAIDSQMGVHRFQDGKKSRFWFSAKTEVRFCVLSLMPTRNWTILTSMSKVRIILPFGGHGWLSAILALPRVSSRKIPDRNLPAKLLKLPPG